MLSPLFLGLLFFAYSGISGLIAVKNAKIFNQVRETPLQIGDFEIQEIDTNTNQVKWILKAVNSQSDLAQNKAQVNNPQLVFFDPDTNYQQIRFTITAKYAQFNKQEQEINLNDNVLLISSDSKYRLRAGQLKFQEKLPHLIVSQNWTLDSNDGYQISGGKGLIRKDFSSILSQDHAECRKESKTESLNIKAEQITLRPNQEEIIIAEKSAIFEVNPTTILTAEKIIISKDGGIVAEQAVNAKSNKINCFSEHLVISLDSKKKPQQAIFTQNPYIIQGLNTIYADKIIYDFTTEKASILGNVHSE